MDSKKYDTDVEHDLEGTKMNQGNKPGSAIDDASDKGHQGGKEWDSAADDEHKLDDDGQRDTDLDVKKQGGSIKDDSAQRGDKYSK